MAAKKRAWRGGRHTLDLFEYAEDYCRYAPEAFDHVWLVLYK